MSYYFFSINELTLTFVNTVTDCCNRCNCRNSQTLTINKINNRKCCCLCFPFVQYIKQVASKS